MSQYTQQITQDIKKKKKLVLQDSLFSDFNIKKSINELKTVKNYKKYLLPIQANRNVFFELQNRRYLGNKYKLLGFIEDIISKKC